LVKVVGEGFAGFGKVLVKVLRVLLLLLLLLNSPTLADILVHCIFVFHVQPWQPSTQQQQQQKYSHGSPQLSHRQSCKK